MPGPWVISQVCILQTWISIKGVLTALLSPSRMAPGAMLRCINGSIMGRSFLTIKFLSARFHGFLDSHFSCLKLLVICFHLPVAPISANHLQFDHLEYPNGPTAYGCQWLAFPYDKLRRLPNTEPQNPAAAIHATVGGLLKVNMYQRFWHL